MVLLAVALFSQAVCDISEIPNDFQFTQDLQRGAKGTEVKYLQLVLQCIVGENVVGAADGDFGPKTEEAVKQYQRMRGLKDDGEVGPNTRAALNADLAALRTPPPPTLVSPEDNSTVNATTPTFIWNSVSNADYYALFISEPPYGEAHLVFNSKEDYGPIYGTSFTTLPSGILSNGVTYRWNMSSHNSAGWSDEYSDAWEFTVQLPNQLPTCSISANPRSGKAPLAVTFLISASDSDGTISAWVLDVNGDGNADYSGTGNPPSTRTHTYTSPGTYTTILIVSDDNDATAFVTETITVTQTPITRIMRLEGNLNFGNVEIGKSSQRTLTIHNDGNSTLTVSSITYPTGFSGNWSGDISAGSYKNVIVTFSPTQIKNYSVTITINSNNTSGTNTISASGTGILPECTVQVIPQKDPIVVGETTTFDVLIESVSDLGGFEFRLHYNPSIIEIDNVQMGNFLPQNDFYPLGPNIKDGELVYGASLLGSGSGQTGSGSLARVIIKGIGTGTTALDLQQDVLIIDASSSMNQPIVNTTDSTITITPGIVPITITTNIGSGTTVGIDGTTHNAPYNATWEQGSIHTIGVDSPQSKGVGLRYVFSYWSDSGAQNHQITVPSSETTYTAYLNTQYHLTTVNNPSDAGTITVNPDAEWYNKGTSVTLQAISNSAYVFLKWSGDITGEANPIPVIINSPTSVTANYLKYGDVSGNSDITADDAILILRHAIELIQLSDEKQAIADVSGNGTISVYDALLVLKRAIGLINAFPIESKQGAPVLTTPEDEVKLFAEAIKELRAAEVDETIINQMLKAYAVELAKKHPHLLPKQTALLQNYPNPFNPDTWIPYQLKEVSDVEIRIYNISGQLVRQLHLGYQIPGNYLSKNKAAHWDGKNNKGDRTASGIYFYYFLTEKDAFVRKMILVK